VAESAQSHYSADIPRLRARLLFPLSLVTAVIVGGTFGYLWLWRNTGGTWLDALFMTVTTITTVGYSEVKPLDSLGRIFTMIIAIVGIGSLFYTFGSVMDYLVAVRLADPTRRRKMEKHIDKLTGHTILAGLGRVGRQAAQELAAARAPFVVVDPTEASVRMAEDHGWLCLQGDATDDAVLEHAGVRRAHGLIATTANDATNMYIVLSARVLNSKLHIVSRAVDESSVPKLMRAGADRAISPYAIGGHRLAHLILSPSVVDFFETALRRGNEALNIEAVDVIGESPAVDRTLEKLALRQTTGATVLAIIRDGNPMVNPPGDLALARGDRLLVLGTRDQLERVERVLARGGA
jgi:voltage-gated potassium channel